MKNDVKIIVYLPTLNQYVNSSNKWFLPVTKKKT